MKDYVAIYN